MPRLLVGALALSLTFAVGTGASAAPIQWNSGVGANNNWYELVLIASDAAEQDWELARDAAAAMMWMGAAGHLVTITSAEENAFIANTPSLQTGTGDAVAFTGGADSITEGVWIWMVGPEAGNLIVYSAWASGEPNNYMNYNEDYVAYVVGPGGGKPHASWVDIPQDPSLYCCPAVGFLVEWEAAEINPIAAVPEPTTLLLLGSGLAVSAIRRRARRP